MAIEEVNALRSAVAMLARARDALVERLPEALHPDEQHRLLQQIDQVDEAELAAARAFAQSAEVPRPDGPAAIARLQEHMARLERALATAVAVPDLIDAASAAAEATSSFARLCSGEPTSDYD